ncbi:MAG: acyl carrier protein [Gemmatimonadota bacterium]
MGENQGAQLAQTIRQLLAEHGRLTRDPITLPAEADLYHLGLTSHASVNVMLALEGAFDIEFPDYMLTRGMFASIDALGSAVGTLLAG